MQYGDSSEVIHKVLFILYTHYWVIIWKKEDKIIYIFNNELIYLGVIKVNIQLKFNVEIAQSSCSS